MGCLAASFELRADVGGASHAPGKIFRAPAKDSGHEGACPLSHLLRPPRRDLVAALLGAPSCASSGRTATAAILPPRRPLPSRRPRWPARVRRDLEGPSVSTRSLPAFRRRTVARTSVGGLLLPERCLIRARVILRAGLPEILRTPARPRRPRRSRGSGRTRGLLRSRGWRPVRSVMPRCRKPRCAPPP